LCFSGGAASIRRRTSSFLAWSLPDMNEVPSDNDLRKICAAVGLALSQWETMELGLAILYSIFLGKPKDLNLLIQFGDLGPTFSSRKVVLERAAEQYFIAHPNQDDEGELREILEWATGLSKHRHQIAHGTAWPVGTQPSDLKKTPFKQISFRLIPP
jgi:hypothetical protein